MRLNRMLAIAVLLAFTAGPLVAQKAGRASDDAEVLLQAAMHQEQVEGRLPEAIDAYKVIVTKAGPNKTVAAKALMQMARSYEKLGRPEARATYQTIVRDYSDQPAVVSAARARLSALAPVKAQTEGLTPRRIMTSETFINAVSPDGRLAVGPRHDSPGEDLMIHDIATGQMRRLLDGSTSGGGFPPVFSRDTRQVAYFRSERGVAGAALRVIGTETGATPRIVFGPDVKIAWIAPVAWSVDDRAILALIAHAATPNGRQGDAPYSIAWISVADGTVQSAKSFEGWRRLNFNTIPGKTLSLSPDGNFIAFAANAQPGSTDQHIYVTDATLQPEIDVVKIAGANTNPVWTPDGTHLLFVSNRSGDKSLWSVPVQSGRAAGEPTLLQSGFTDLLLGMSSTGDLYYSHTAGGASIEVIAERGPGAARVVHTISGAYGRLSPDGASMALIPATHPDQENTVIVRSLATGEERSYSHTVLAGVFPRWLPDGTGFIVLVNAQGGRPRSFYLVDARTGTFTSLFAQDTDTRVRSNDTDVSPDGKTLYMMARNAGALVQNPWTALVGVDLSTGAERAIATIPAAGCPEGGPARVGTALAVSPDGTTLALECWNDAKAELNDDPAKRQARLMTVRVDGTGYRELYGPFPVTDVGAGISWTPDGRDIVFSRADDPRLGRIMRISADGGQPEFDGLDTAALKGPGTLPLLAYAPEGLHLSADGSKIAFSTLSLRTFELWALENVMAVLNKH